MCCDTNEPSRTPRRSSSASSALNRATSPGLTAMKIGDVTRLGAPRIDHHDLHVLPRLFGRFPALEQHGMAPGEIAANQHDEIGRFRNLIETGHCVSLPKARLWPATEEAMQSCELVSILAKADEALDQLVGSVIVLGQQLARDVEGDGVRSVAGDDVADPLSHRIERAANDARRPSISDAAAGPSSDRVWPNAAPLEQRRP